MEIDNASSSWNNCYVKIHGKFIEVKDGFIVDPKTNAQSKLDFFYLSYCHKMVLMDFEDAVHEIKKALNHHKCRRKMKTKSPYRVTQSYSMVCQKIEQLQEMIEKKECRCSLANNQSNGCQEKLTTTAIIEREKPDLQSVLNRTNSSNRTYLIEKDESNNNSGHRNWPSHTSRSLTKGKPTNKESGASFQISYEHLGVIGKWVSKNRDFMPYKGMAVIPEGLFETDDEYFLQLIFSLNPTVVLERNFPNIKIGVSSITPVKTQRKNYADSYGSSEMTQSEFARELGLIHRASDLTNSNETSKSKSKPIAKPKPKQISPPNKVRRRLDQSMEFHKNENLNDIKRSNFVESNKENCQTSKAGTVFSVIDKWKSDIKPKLIQQPENKSPPRNLRPSKNLNYSMRNLNDKAQYTAEEDRIILNWILEGTNSIKVNGNYIWKELERKQIMPNGNRTWQSLRNRFLKTILSQLRNYGLPKYDMSVIIRGAHKGCIQRKSKDKFISKPNYGLVIKKKTLNNQGNKASEEEAKMSKKISPTRITHVKRPKITKETKSRNSYYLYSESDVLSDNAPELSYAEYKNRLRNNSGQSGTIPTKQKKLFTQNSFLASVTEKLSVIMQ